MGQPRILPDGLDWVVIERVDPSKGKDTQVLDCSEHYPRSFWTFRFYPSSHVSSQGSTIQRNKALYRRQTSSLFVPSLTLNYFAVVFQAQLLVASSVENIDT